MPTTLVTGATGFVGSHVARALVARGDDVRVSVRAASRREPPAGLDVETVQAEVTDRRAVRRALRRRGARVVAAGHLLADELGVPGERYILGNHNYTWDLLFADLARLSGIEAPALKLPVPAALALAETLGRLPGPTPVTPVEIRSAAHWWTYRSTKARRELGWSTRPHEETVEATVAWHREREGGRLARSGTRYGLGWRLAGSAARRLSELVP